MSQIEFDTAEKKLTQAYERDFKRRLARMQETSRRHAIPLLPVHTEAPVLDQIRTILGARRG